MPELTETQKAEIEAKAKVAAQQVELVAAYKACEGKRYKANGDESGRFEVVDAYNGVRQFADKNLYHTFRVHQFRADGSSDAVYTPACKLFLETHEELTS